MFRRNRRTLQVAAATALLVTAATACNAAAKNDAAGSASGGSGPSFTLVTPDGVGQNEFLKLAVTGIKDAAKQHDGTQKVYESTDTASQQQNVQAAVDAKPDVIVLVGFEFADLVAQQAQKNPKQQFLIIDACTSKTYKNVSCAVFREHEAVYLAGAEAGLLSKSGKVGAVDVLDTPQFRRYSDPFTAGAKKVAPKTAAQVAKYGGVQGEQLDPCYHEACDTYSTVTGQPPASTMNTFPTNPVLAQQQADSLNGNALRSLEQFKGTLVHAVWYFARVKDAFPSKATVASATTAKRSSHFTFQGHMRATTR